MKRAQRSPRFVTALIGLGLVAVCSTFLPALTGPARASDSTPGSFLEGVLPADANDSVSVLLTARPKNTIRDDQDAAHAAAQAADGDMDRASRLLARLKARIEVLKSEIDALKGKARLAREQNNAAEQASLEAQIRAQELRQDLLQEVRDMRDAEKNMADARKKAAEARAKFHERELEFAAKWAELENQRTDGTPEQIQKLERAVSEYQRKALDALKEMTGRQQDASKAESNVADARFKILETQIEMAKPKK